MYMKSFPVYGSEKQEKRKDMQFGKCRGIYSHSLPVVLRLTVYPREFSITCPFFLRAQTALVRVDVV